MTDTPKRVSSNRFGAAISAGFTSTLEEAVSRALKQATDTAKTGNKIAAASAADDEPEPYFVSEEDKALYTVFAAKTDAMTDEELVKQLLQSRADFSKSLDASHQAWAAKNRDQIEKLRDRLRKSR